MTEPTLSILIVNFNGKQFLSDCLKSIAQFVSCPHEVILVDNASSDGSVDYVRQNFPTVIIIANQTNSGFSVGNNIAAKRATGKYLLLLNNDTELQTDVRAGIALLDSDNRIGVIGAKMSGKNQEYRLSAGYFPSPLRLIKLSRLYRLDGPFRTGNFADQGNARAKYSVDWVEGSFLLTRSNMWRDIGGLDEASFMYGEDIDYCKRVKLLGSECSYMPSISYLHYGGYGAERLPLIIAGFLRFHNRHSSLSIRIATRTVLLLKLSLSMCAHWVSYLFGRAPASLARASASWQAVAVVARGVKC
jgi:GT2 family glycosyltransferase